MTRVENGYDVHLFRTKCQGRIQTVPSNFSNFVIDKAKMEQSAEHQFVL